MTAAKGPVAPRALFVLEFDSVALGVAAADAAAKKATLELWSIGTVQPGRYLIVGGGDVASAEECYQAGRLMGARTLLDSVFLPAVAPAVSEALAGPRGAAATAGEALAVLETTGAAAVVAIADTVVKGCAVELQEVRFGDGLGGKGVAFFRGALADAQEATELARLGAYARQLVEAVVLTRSAEELDRALDGGSRLSSHLGGVDG